MNSWNQYRHFVIKSPTGSGKSLALPFLLATSGLVSGKILVVQPRRLAARMLARRAACLSGWELGEQVGYQVRFDSRFSPQTKILYVTDGVAEAKLLNGRELEGTEVLILDEFHERSAQIDLCLALALKLTTTTRSDLRIVVTSATLDVNALLNHLPDSTSMEFSQRSYPVEVDYQARDPALPVWRQVDRLMPKLLDKTKGDVLIFMDGAHAISRTVDALLSSDASRGLLVRPLYGDLSDEKQDLALAKTDMRKIIVSTNIAETSLTIDGVRVVVDTGVSKKLNFDSTRGINALLPEPICRSSADQRTGRAGRQEPGYCLRLWSESENNRRREFEIPEILRVDLSESYLKLLASGHCLSELNLLDKPDSDSLTRAIQSLRELGALDEQERLTEHGREMGKLPMHPRWAHALLIAKKRGFCSVIALLLAMLEDRPPVEEDRLAEFHPGATPRSDPYCMLLAYEEAARRKFQVEACRTLGIQARRCLAAERLARSLCDKLGEEYSLNLPCYEEFGKILLEGFTGALAYRVSAARAIYEDSEGKRMHLSKRSALVNEPFVLPLRLIEKKAHGSMVLEMSCVSALDKKWISESLSPQLRSEERVYLDLLSRKVVKRTTLEWRKFILSSVESEEVTKLEKAKAFAQSISKGELNLKNWDSKVEGFLARIRFLCTQFPELGMMEWNEELKELFLMELCMLGSTWKEIRNLPVLERLKNVLSRKDFDLLEDAAPAGISLIMGGKTYPLDYTKENEVVLRARLQELYEVREHPKIVYNKHPLLIEILAPNLRVVQRTTNLPEFWSGTYPLVRKELAGRYPKHEWR